MFFHKLLFFWCAFSIENFVPMWISTKSVNHSLMVLSVFVKLIEKVFVYLCKTEM
jgi:hypothetical protein